MTTTEPKRPDPFMAFLVIACAGLAVVAFLLAHQNRSLKTQLNAINRAASQPPADALKPGDVVQPIPVVDATGTKSSIGFGEGEAKTILLVFSSSCPACQETMPKWKTLLGPGTPSAVRIVAVRTDAGEPGHDTAAPDAQPLPFPVYQEDSASALLKKVPFIPATFVIDAKGVVTQAWFGVPTEEQEAELARELKVAQVAPRAGPKKG